MLNKDVKVAVLVAAYNGEKFIEEQISSIAQQENISVKIYISVEPSSDNTHQICSNIAKANPKVDNLPITKSLGSAALNFFRLIKDISFCEFDYIAFSDQDDIWYPTKVARAITILETKQFDGYSSNVIAFWPDGKQKIIKKSQPMREWDFLFESAGPGCTFVLTKNLAIHLQSFIEQNQSAINNVWLHDWFIYAFARAYNYNWYIDPIPSMLYRQHTNNQVGVNRGYRAFFYRMKFVLSGKALEQSALLARLFQLNSSLFVKHWHNLSRSGFLFLAFNSHKCRRKHTEQIIFMMSCLLLSLIGHKKQ